MKSSKSRQTNSSFGYFDLGKKEIVAYNLKHLLLLSLRSNGHNDPTPLALPSKMGTLANKVNSRRKLAIVGPKTDHLTVPFVRNIPTVRCRSAATWYHGKSNKDLGIEPRSPLPKPTSFYLELPWGDADLHTMKGLQSKAKHTTTYLAPHEVKKSLQNDDTWNWLSWNMKRNNPISGRIGRSLQRAGICVLLGGFTAFLPYKEYSIRNKMISTKEADLQSFQILSMKHANLNCVLSKDRVTYSSDRNWGA